jgi:hypothetical protein
MVRSHCGAPPRAARRIAPLSGLSSAFQLPVIEGQTRNREPQQHGHQTGTDCRHRRQGLGRTGDSTCRARGLGGILKVLRRRALLVRNSPRRLRQGAHRQALPRPGLPLRPPPQYRRQADRLQPNFHRHRQCRPPVHQARPAPVAPRAGHQRLRSAVRSRDRTGRRRGPFHAWAAAVPACPTRQTEHLNRSEFCRGS